MTAPITPPAPVNPIITIHPVTSQSPSRDATPNPLATLASGTLVEGFVVNRDASNNPILRTSMGDLKVTSDVFLKTGSEVVFRVDTSQASLARILSVDGMTPEEYNAQNTTRTLTADTISQQIIPNTQLLSNIGKPGGITSEMPILQALILQAHAPAKPSPPGSLAAPLPLLAQLAQMRPGTPLRLAIQDIRLPPMPVALSSLPTSNKLDALLPPTAALPLPRPAGQQIPSANTPPLTQPPASSPVVKTPFTQAPHFPFATEPAENNPTASATIPHPRPLPEGYKQTSPTAAPLASPVAQKSENRPALPTITADVIGHDADGANILHTPHATIKLYTPQPLPTGTTLYVQIEPDHQAAPPPITPLTPEEKFITDATRNWDSLDEAIGFLKANHPDIANEVAQRLPNMGHKFLGNLINIMATVKSGEVAGILGKRAAKLLETNAPDLFAKLKGDFAQIQTNTNNSSLPHWSWIALPWMHAGEFHQARLYVSKEPPENEKQGGTSHGQRFILEVGLSELGSLQFDGFVRERQEGKSFDLIVRSDKPLSDDVSEGIRDIFSNSAAITGMRGQVQFQQGTQHFINPLAEHRPTSGPGAPNTILA